jgi:hypothetical protein
VEEVGEQGVEEQGVEEQGVEEEGIRKRKRLEEDNRHVEVQRYRMNQALRMSEAQASQELRETLSRWHDRCGL